MPDEPSRPAPVEVHTGPAATIDATGKVLTRLGSLSQTSVINIIIMLFAVALTALGAFNVWESRNDRRDERRVAGENAAAFQRLSEEREERMRQFTATEREKDRAATLASQKEAQKTAADLTRDTMKHCAEEREKDRKAMAALAGEISKLAKQQAHDPEEFCPIRREILPPPRVKGTTP